MSPISIHRQIPAPSAALGFRMLTFAVVCAALASAAAGDPTVSIQWGFNGFHRPGCWTPLTVLIENVPLPNAPGGARGKDVTGRILVSSPSAGENEQGAQIDINVPWQTRKRYQLYIKASDDRRSEIVVRVFDTRGRVLSLTPITLKPVIEPDRLAVSLSSESFAALSVPSIERSAPIQVHPAANAPDRWIGYDGVDVIVVPRYSANMLDPGQLDALRQWVAAGGHLVILGGRDALSLRGSDLEKLAPARARGLVEAPAATLAGAGRRPSAEANVVLADLEPAAGARVVWQHEGRPLVVRRALGLGAIDVWAFDFTARADAVRDLWDSMFDARRAASRRQDFFETFTTGYDFNMDIRKPNLSLVGLALLLYFIVVGPINFYALSRRRRLEWGWVTVPAVVAVFSVAIYTVAYRAKGGQLVKRTFALVQTRAGQSVARASCIGGVFSPMSHRYSLAFARGAGVEKASLDLGGAALLPLSPWIDINQIGDGVLRPGATGSTFNPARMGAGGGGVLTAGVVHPVAQSGPFMLIDGLSMKQWSLEYFEGEALVDLGGAVEASLVRDGTMVRGTITNATALHLDDATLVVGGSARFIGELAPGATANVSVEAQRPGLAPEAAGFGDWCAGAAERYAGASPGRARQTEARVRAMFIEKALNCWPIGPVPRAGDAPLLIAWPREPVVELEIGVTAEESSRHAMLACECEAPPAGAGASFGRSAGPPAHASLAFLEAIGKSESVEIYGERSQRRFSRANGPAVALGEGGAITLAFQPPLPAGLARPAGAVLFVQYSTEDKDLRVVASAFNHRSGVWDVFDGFTEGQGQWVPLSTSNLNPFDHRATIQLKCVEKPRDPMDLTSRPRSRESCVVTAMDVAFRFAPAGAEEDPAGRNAASP